MQLRVPVSDGDVWAEDCPGDNPPAVLLHPGWGDSDIWKPVMQRLRRRVRTIRYDVRGYGRSPSPSVPFTQLGDLRAVLDHLAVPPAVVVGHSGGGGTAISLALAEPSRVRALVLLAPGLADYPWPEEDPYFVQFAALLSAGDREGIMRLGLQTWAPAGHHPDVEAQVSSATTAFFAEGDLLRPDPPALNRLEHIDVPSVVVTAELDHPMVTACAHTIATRITGCQEIAAAGSDHMLPLRVPDLIAGLILQHKP
ncbi:MAG TPA: alpha/beta hydrolase [Actinophytocola sp.]|uniref:alpha/beta fold hydrolase n=1 Tax=Actinophytocola sp. TaxID=1872138 RepID=UPI002E0C1374|nr:alpha/beta hydrolase [Actinophytocola sp.]